MSTFGEPDLVRAKRYGLVTPNGIAYVWRSAGFVLYREPRHTDADVQAVKSHLHNERGAVSMDVYKPEKT